ncbi:MAG: hypothetical protein L0Y58_13600 [Verrucomicrobia subdivision 3 bacterium]|nr:hypothetical protein [Limisphaerales bacterium]
MPNDPLSIAIQEIAETKRLLESLVTSSESFDYPAAKLTIKHLNRKIRELGKLQNRFQLQKFPAPDPKIHVIDFTLSR